MVFKEFLGSFYVDSRVSGDKTSSNHLAYSYPIVEAISYPTNGNMPMLLKRLWKIICLDGQLQWCISGLLKHYKKSYIKRPSFYSFHLFLSSFDHNWCLTFMSKLNKRADKKREASLPFHKTNTYLSL